jgi:SAM-dependent methyltransferase
MMPPLYKRLFSRTARKSAVLRGMGLVTSAPSRNASGMTRTQELFVQWNAERLGISPEEMTDPEPKWSRTDLVARQLAKRYEVSVVDFGCGLAQQSRTLAEYLRDVGVRVRLTLVDIPTLRQEFLLWWGRHAKIQTTFLSCTAEAPIPELPECDLCQATGFFEHVHDPVAYFNRIDAKLAAGGLLITGIMDHHQDFMHVSPQLRALRERIAECGYEALVRDRILRKR